MEMLLTYSTNILDMSKLEKELTALVYYPTSIDCWTKITQDGGRVR